MLSEEEFLGILDVLEEETSGGDAVTGRAAVLLFDSFTELLDGEFFSSYIDERADDGTNHIAQEAVRFDAEDESVGGLLPTSVHDAAVVGLDVGVKFGERGEVEVVEEVTGCLVHQFDIKRAKGTHRVEMVERGLACSDIISVGAAEGTESSVGIRRDRDDAEDGDVGRQ